MRIAHLLRPAQGGMLEQVRGLLSDPAVEPLLAAPPSVIAALAPGVKEAAFPLPNDDGFMTQFRAGWACGRWLKTVGAEVVHGHGLKRIPLYAVAARRAKLPLVVTLHNLVPPLGVLSRTVLNLCLHRATVVAVSEAVAKSAPIPTTVIYNGIDLNRFATLPDKTDSRDALGIPMNAFVVLCLARLAPEKGIDTLISTPVDGILLIGGDGPERTALEAQAQPSVRFLGQRRDLGTLFAAADVYVQPSRSEGLGLAVLEAMAAGLPVVASRVGGLPELLSDPSVGVLVPPDDPSALAAALTELQHDPTRRTTMGTNARRRVAERFSASAMREATRRVYREVIR